MKDFPDLPTGTCVSNANNSPFRLVGDGLRPQAGPTAKLQKAGRAKTIYFSSDPETHKAPMESNRQIIELIAMLAEPFGSWAGSRPSHVYGIPVLRPLNSKGKRIGSTTS